ncbi:MAG: uroporphyrinogen-III C-methyltransferase [Magnetovibrio sp.]|nr:uroporphyrinogen-III C-methyltransferase [Magnetovibrio sp.]
MKPLHPVYLVGAGPGDPDLMTVKAQRLLGDVDVIVYDKLVSEQILAMIPAGTTRIFAGKQARNHHMPQPDINSLLVDLAKSGRRVMRLKGGDPFVFGRGGEEAQYLAEHGVSFEVVPGITSSAGCAAYAGIPLTHRDLAHSVRFVTGHTKGADGLDLNWESLADPQTTLVVYMGLTNVRLIAERLIGAGLPADTPAAAINNGTRPEQKVVNSRLDALADDIESHRISGATLLVIGRVAELAEHLAWFGAAGGTAQRINS